MRASSQRRQAVWLLLFAALSLAVPCAGLAADAAPDEVPVEVWDRPRSGRVLLGVPAVRRALAALSADANVRLAIRHPAGGDEAAQAEELKAWLVAHGIGPERIGVRGDLPPRQPLRLDVSATGQQ